MRAPLLALAPLFRPHLALVAAGSAGLAVAAAMNVVAPMLVAHAIDVDLANQDRDGLLRRCAGYAAAILVSWLATFVSRIALEVAAQRAMFRLKQDLFDHLAGHDVAFHDRTASGSLIGRVQGDVEALRILFVEVLLVLPADSVLIVGMLVVLAVQAPAVSGPVFAVLPVYLGLFLLFRWIAPKYFLQQRTLVSLLTGAVTETVRVLPVLRSLGRHVWARDRAIGLVDASCTADVLSHWQPIWYFNATQAFRSLATVAILVQGGLLVARGETTVGVLVMALTYLRQVFQPLMRLSNHLATLERARASADRIAGLLAEPRTVTDPAVPRPWPGVRTGLRLQGVVFSYVPGTPVLRGIDLDIPAGARVGIVGPTGSGKSTIVDLVLRFRDPVGGRVTVDGVDLRELALADIRRRTALVLQDVRLLPGTVAENLGGDRTAARAALDALGIELSLDERIEESTASRGERQLLTFARALIGDPDLLVLDEATSAIDPRTEARVQRALDTLTEGRTVVIVAHRLETVRHCDRIYVLRAGEVAESGSHAELLAQDGVYAALVRLQEAA